LKTQSKKGTVERGIYTLTIT